MSRFLGCLLLVLVWARPAQGYVDVSPTLGWLVKDSPIIAVLQVDRVSQEKRAILFKKVADLKGTLPDEVVRHKIAEGSHPREPRIVMDWAEPKKLAICFVHGNEALICIGQYWYQCAALQDGWWTMTSGRPELSLAFFGRATKLRTFVKDILSGKEVVVTAIDHGTHSGIFKYTSVAYREPLRGKDSPVFRIKASLDMPGSVWEVGGKNSKWIVGPGAAGAEDVPALVKRLKGKLIGTRARAAEDLGLVGWKARSAVPALVEALEDPASLVRVHAALALVKLGAEQETALDVLSAKLRKGTVKARRTAAGALGDLGSDARAAVPVLINALGDRNGTVRWAAAEALGQIGSDAAVAVPALATALSDPAIRVIAADALGRIGVPSRGCVPLLVEALKDQDSELQWSAAVALTRIDARSAKLALPLFIEKLQSPDIRTRWDAVMCIMPMGLEAKAAAPAVRAWAKKGNGVAAMCLAAISGPEAEDVLETLIHVLDDDWDTTESFAQIGPAAIPQLLELLRQPNKTNHHLAVKGLGLLASRAPEVIPEIAGALKHPVPRVRKAAAIALGELQPRSREVVPALQAALQDDDATVRLAAGTALRLVAGPADPLALKAVVGLLRDKDPEIRRQAAFNLAAFGKDAKIALPHLKALEKDSDANVCTAAAWAIARIGAAEANQAALVVLIKSLTDKDTNARREAARLLGAMGADASDAIPALLEARLDDHEGVRRAVADALERIQGRQGTGS